MRFIVLLVFLIKATTSFCQFIDCGTSPMSQEYKKTLRWYGNNFYLDSLNAQKRMTEASSYRFNNSTFAVNNSMYKVPLHFWVYRDQNGNDGGINPSYIQSQMDSLNHIFRINSTGIQFYITCATTFVNDNNSLSVTQNRAKEFAIQNRIEGVINVHIFREIQGFNGLNFGSTGIALTFLSENFSTFAHEIGHHFDLDHTNEGFDQFNCLKEPISRSRRLPNQCRIFYPTFTCLLSCPRMCELTGDGLCDTPADPNLSDETLINGCDFIDRSLVDSWGDFYFNTPPDTRNIMALTFNRECRNHFSEGQVAVMIDAIPRKGFAHDGIFNPITRYYFDLYEPDNSSETARNIDLNTSQHHTFHWTKQSTSEVRFCDEDWFRFVITDPDSDKPLEISTENGFFENADTELFLFHSSDLSTPIAQDDNSNGSGFSRIRINNIPSGEYFVRLVPRNFPSTINNVIDYTIEVKICLPNEFCLNGVLAEGQSAKYYAKDIISAPCLGETFKIEAKSSAILYSERVVELNNGFEISNQGQLEIIIGEIGFESCDENLQFQRLSSRISNYDYPIEPNHLTEDEELPEVSDSKHIYPNPTTDVLKIYTYSPVTSMIRIFDMYGMLVHEELVTETDYAEIDMKNEVSGFYIVEISSARFNTVREKVLVLH